MAEDRIGYGLIGCGAFGLFCLEAYQKMPGIRIAATADVRPALAAQAARPYHANACDPMELIAREDVQLIHIATLPSTHHVFTLAAIAAGKHVLVEKPLALNLAQGQEIVDAAAKAGRIAPVNFVLRYNPITDAVRAVIDSGVLGAVLSARLTNCATDTQIPDDHWFWNPSISGGIFVEHGVHFFDMYNYWLGSGRVVSALSAIREQTAQEDRVQCEIAHQSGAIASHYHGFDQIRQMDRTDHRLVCEMGDIAVEGWIPMKMVVTAAVNDADAKKLAAACPDGQLETVEQYSPLEVQTTGRGKPRHVTRLVRLTVANQADKLSVYSQSLRDLLADQLAFIRDPSHNRRITESNGRDALVLAEAASRLAQRIA